MKIKKPLFKIFAVLVAVMVFCCLFAGTQYDDYEYRAILPYTELHSKPDINSPVLNIKVPQNEQITTDGISITGEDGNVWIKAEYTGFEGYALLADFYKSASNNNYAVKPMTVISSTRMGKDVNLYASHIAEAEVVETVHDGVKVYKIDNGIDYGDFTYIEYDGDYYFIRSENLTNGLGYNQRLAVIISCCFVGVIVAAIIVIIVLRKKKSVN